MSKEIDMMLRWKNDPIAFFVEVLGMNKDYIWPKMEEVCYSVRDNRKTAVKAGHGLSKSFTAARIVLWYLYTHYPATVFTTAPTHQQVENILWREIKDAKAKAKFNLPGKLTATGLDLGKADGQEEGKWFAIGFATKPDQGQENATKLQGLHNENFLAVFDEACGIIRPIWEAKEGLLTAESCRFLAIGNPTQSMGDFIDCFYDPTYNKITISVFDSPNYKLGKEVIPGLSGKDFVESIRAKYGEDSNQWKSRVTGEIPDIDANSLLSKGWIERAVNTHIERDRRDKRKRFVTWDVSDGGTDPHVICSWDWPFQVDYKELHGKEIEEAEPYVWRALRKLKGNTIIYDADGIGRVAGKYLQMSADQDTDIIAFEGSSTQTSDDTMYFNVRAEGHWDTREIFKENKINLMAISDQTEELSVLKLKDNTKGLIQMEKKDIIRKEIGRSTNFSDNVVMACWGQKRVKPCDIKRKKNSDMFDEHYSFMGA